MRLLRGTADTSAAGEGRRRRRPMGHVLEREQWVSAGIEETFSFFANAANLEAITPPFLDFSIVSPPPIVMHEGTLVEYRLGLFGIPIGWLTRIEEWVPERSFTDVQLRGPYALWVHRHRFTPQSGGTLIADRVEYRLPAAPWSDPVRALFVRPTIERIFDYRRDVIRRVLD